MGLVMRADVAGTFPVGSLAVFGWFPATPETWLTFDFAIDSAAFADWTGVGNSPDFAFIKTGAIGLSWRILTGFWTETLTGLNGAVVPPAAADTWFTCECHAKSDGTVEFFIDGATIFSGGGGELAAGRQIVLGLFSDIDVGSTGIVYFDNVKVGTTRGGTDIFEDDFESGTFAAWDSTDGDVSIVDDPFVPPLPPPVVQADTPIRTLITDMDSRTIAHFDRLETDRAWLFTLNAAAYHTGQVPSDSLEVNRPFPDADSPANLTNNRRLIFSLQRWKGSTPPYQPIFGGIVTIPEDQGTDAPTTRYTAHDPWQLMMSRPIRDPDTGDLPGPDGITFASGSRASDIALSFLAQTEAFDGESHIDSSDTGLIEATDPLPSEITFDEGTMVGEAWTQLVETGTIDIHLPPMYEPIDAPGKVVRFQTVRQADDVAAGPIRADAVMGWDRAGNSVAEINRLVDGTRMANTVQFYDANGNKVPVQTDPDSATANGVYFAQQFFPGANDTTLIALLAVAQLAIRRKGQRSISLSPTPERTVMPLRDYGLGDYLPVWASSNLREPLGVDYDTFDPVHPGASGYQRVYAIPLAADDNGVTTVAGLLTSKEN